MIQTQACQIPKPVSLIRFEIDGFPLRIVLWVKKARGSGGFGLRRTHVEKARKGRRGG